MTNSVRFGQLIGIPLLKKAAPSATDTDQKLIRTTALAFSAPILNQTGPGSYSDRSLLPDSELYTVHGTLTQYKFTAVFTDSRGRVTQFAIPLKDQGKSVDDSQTPQLTYRDSDNSWTLPFTNGEYDFQSREHLESMLADAKALCQKAIAHSALPSRGSSSFETLV